MGRGNCCCTPDYIKFGTYKRRSDHRVIQRYRCRNCKKSYSSASDDAAYQQNKRHLNHSVMMLLASNVSMRRIAILLNTTRKTVARKLIFLGEDCRHKLDALAKQMPLVTELQFDELQTIEHTKCKPLSAAVAVNAKTREILGFQVSSMPATGHLAKIARKKYGFRPDHRRQGLRTLLESIRSVTSEQAHFLSDYCPFYAPVLKTVFPKATHHQVLGEKACVAGQGELKKAGKDPLFCINQSFAMLRANINRLIRRTWCTTKVPERLRDHLAVYAYVHNQKLLRTKNA